MWKGERVSWRSNKSGWLHTYTKADADSVFTLVLTRVYHVLLIKRSPFKRGTFLNCMTRFMREDVVLWACWAVPMEDCSRSSMEILFLRAW